MIHQLKNIFLQWGLEKFGRYYSLYRGIVVDNEDPEAVGRLKVSVAQVSGTVVIDRWAFPMGMPAGKDYGFYSIPKKDEMVWVQFELGNPRIPVWSHGHWAKDEISGDNAVHFFQTPEGQRIEFDDENNKVRIVNKSGNIVSITKDGIFVGNSNFDLHDFLTQLLNALTTTTTGTALGPQPFINNATFVTLAKQIDKFLNDTD